MRKKFLFLLLVPALAIAQFGGGVTTKQIDKIINNVGTDIVLEPIDKVDISYFAGEFVLQSTADGELEESAITNTELGYLSGLTSNVQTQIDSKEPNLPLDTAGDLLLYNSGMQKLGIGTPGQLLTMDSGLPSWQDAPISTTLDTKGQLQGFSTINANVGPCTDDQILLYDAVEATGWKCSPLPSTSPTTTEGDLILRGSSADERLAIGGVGQLLTSNGTTASWEDAPVSLPDQTGQANNLLTTNGTTASWAPKLPVKQEAYNTIFGVFGNPRFEEGLNSWANANCTASTVSSIAALNNSAELTCTAQAVSFEQTTTKFASLAGKQGLAVCKVKADFPFDFKILANGADDITKTYAGNNNFEFLEIPFVFNSTSNAIKLESAAVTGTLLVDDCDLKLMPEGYIKEIAGSLELLQVRDSGAYSAPNNAESTLSFDTVVKNQGSGSYSNGVYTLGASGDYEVEGSILFNTVAAASKTYRLFVFVDGVKYSDIAQEVQYTSISIDPIVSFGTTVLNLNKGQTLEVKVYQNSGAGLFVNAVRPFNNVVTFKQITSAARSVITQENELTAKTANTLSFNMSSGGVVTGDSYDFINGNCTLTSYWQCNLNDIGITQPMQCSLSFGDNDSTDGNAVWGSFLGNTTSYLRFNSSKASVGNNGLKLEIICNKHDDDLNKSATIVGKFENINSTETFHLVANTGNAMLIPNASQVDVTWDNIEKQDGEGTFNGSVFTAANDGYYDLNAQFHMEAVSGIYTMSIAAYKNASTEIAYNQHLVDTGIGFQQSVSLNKTVYLLAGDTIVIKVFQNSGATRSFQNWTGANWFTVSQQPDTESVVKNLAAETTTLVQTKILPASVSSAGIILQFNNLEIGKWYSYTGMVAASQGGNAIIRDGSGYNFDQFLNGANNGDTIFAGISTNIFKATTTTIYMEKLGGSGSIIGGAGQGQTWMQLRELPKDRYIETNKFD